MKEVAYLFGAGVSHQSIPTVANLAKSMKSEIGDMLRIIQTPNFQTLLMAERNSVHTRGAIAQQVSDFTAEVQDFLNEYEHSEATIDTFIMGMYPANMDFRSFRRAKSILTIYFLWIQRKNRKVSPLLRNLMILLTSYNQGRPTLANNVVVLNWNYDIQVELALSKNKRTTNFDLDVLFDECNSVSNLDTSAKTGQFSHYHLNGVATFKGPKNCPEPSNLLSLDEHKLILELISLHNEANTRSRNISTSLSFNKEKDKTTSPFWNDMLHEISEVKHLIIFGYSFPQENRAIDTILLNQMKGLKSITIQDLDAERISEIVKSIITRKREIDFENTGINLRLDKVPLQVEAPL